MSFKSSLDAHIKNIYLGTWGAVLKPVIDFSSSFNKVYSKNKRNGILLLIGLILVFLVSCFTSYKALIEPYFEVNSGSQISFLESKSLNTGRAIGGLSVDQDNADEGKKRAVDTYLTTYSSLFDYVGDFFNDYVGTTVDPSGHSKYTSGSVEFIPSVNSTDKLSFSTEDFLYTSNRYSTILLGSVAPILVLLVVITGLEILINQDNHALFAKLSSKMTRLAMSGIMVFIITPLLLTSAVMTTNLLNGAILSTGAKACGWESNQTDLKCFFKQTVDSIKSSQGGGQTVDVAGWDIVGWAKVQTNNFVGFISIIPLVVITLIMVILLFVILIQFVVRYLQLYFLFIIYPIVSVFWFSKDTSKYYNKYWEQIITLLLQQPVFLLCFVIFADMSTALIADITKPANLLIFTIFLGFLATVPATLTARIFGDAFAMAENLQLGDKQNFISKSVQAAPKIVGSMLVNRFRESRNGNNQKGNKSSFSNKQENKSGYSHVRDGSSSGSSRNSNSSESGSNSGQASRSNSSASSNTSNSSNTNSRGQETNSTAGNFNSNLNRNPVSNSSLTLGTSNSNLSTNSKTYSNSSNPDSNHRDLNSEWYQNRRKDRQKRSVTSAT